MALPIFNCDYRANIKTLIDTLSDYARDGHILHIEKIGTVMLNFPLVATQNHVSVDHNAEAVNVDHRHATAGMVTKLSMEVSSIENIVDCRVDQRADPNQETQLCVMVSLMWKAPW